MLISQLSISFSGYLIVILLLIAVMVSAAFFFYRYTLPPIDTKKRFFFSALRALSLTLLLIILFEPILYITSKEIKPASIAVVIDNSQSMTFSSSGEKPAEQVRLWMESNPFSTLPSDIEVQYYLFSSKLQYFSPDAMTFSGEETNMSEMFAQIKKMIDEKNIHSVVLISDGNYNVGKNPIYEAEALGFPVYSIGVGDTLQQKDILIQRILTNNIAYAETRVPVDAVIQSYGHSGENVEVTLTENAVVVDRKVLTLNKERQKYTTRLFFTPKEEGTKKYTVSVSEISGEFTTKNNVQSFFIRVIKGKLKVLIIAGAPHPDVAAVRQVFAEDDRLIVNTFVQKSPSEFYGGSLTQTVLDSADCIIFIGFPTVNTSLFVIEELLQGLNRMAKPLLFISGRAVDYAKLKRFEDFLPFSWTSTSTTEVKISAAVSEKFKSHPFITLQGETSVEAWNQLPPIYKTQTFIRAKPDALVLVSVMQQRIVLPEPLILTRILNQRKTFAITGYGIWRWRLMAQNNQHTEKLLQLLLTNAVRWLTTKEHDKPVMITTTKPIFTTGEPIEFYAQVYDEQLKAVDNAEVIVDVKRKDEHIRCELHALGNGRYEGFLEGIGAGDFSFIGEARAKNSVLGKDQGNFSVGQLNIEFLQTTMNRQILEQISFKTGGKYFDFANAKSTSNGLVYFLTRDLKFIPKEIVNKTKIELWQWEYLLGIIVFLLGTEWFLRKRSGML